MRGKNGTRPRGLSISSENMCFFNDEPLMQGLALFGSGSVLLSHTPPNFTPGSYEVSHMKRARAGSISGRLRSASDLEEKGLIDKSQKGVLKDLIISGDSELQTALDLYDRGDTSKLEALMEAGLLDRRDSLDLLQDLDFGIMDLGTSADQRECNDIIDIIGRKDTTGGDEGHGGGASGGNSGDGAAAAGTGSNGGGGNAEASTPEGDGALDLSVTSDGLLLDRNAFALHYDGKVLALGDEAGLGIKRGDDSGKNGGGGAGEGGGSKGCDNAGPRNGSGCASGQGGTGVAGGGGGAAGGVSAGAGGSGDSDREIDLGGEGSAVEQFDIGDMAFDTTFEHDYDEDEMDLKTEAEATGTAHGALATNAPVGPLPVGGGASQLSSAHHNGGVAGGVARHGDHDPDAIGEGGGRRRRRGGGAAAGVAGASGEVIGVEEHVEQHHDDDDEPCLGSFGMLGVPTAPIGDFSPQFKFSFSDDIHLDLGSGLKDELRDLESLSEPLPGQGCKNSGDSYPPLLGMGGFSSRPQLLSRGGPSVKAEALSPVPQGVGGSRLGPARSGSVVKTAGPPGTELPVGDSSSDSPDDYAMGDAAVEAESHVVTRASSGNVFSTTSAHASAAVPGRHTGHLTAAERRESNHYGGGVSDIGASSTISTSHVVRGRPLTSGTATMGDASGARSGTGVVQERKFVGAYSPEARRQRIQRFLEKREHRVWTKMVKYDVRKNFADTRMRVKGRFVKKEDEALLREVMACA